MENEITTFEQSIKNRMERVLPSRALFEATMHNVTKAQTERSTTMKATPSPYQSLFITMRTKTIGLSLVVVAIIAVVIMKTGNSGILPTTQMSEQTGVTAPATSDAVTPSGSEDEIVASLTDDATAEGTIGASEDEDGTSLTQDLEDYNVDDNALI